MKVDGWARARFYRFTMGRGALILKLCPKDDSGPPQPLPRSRSKRVGFLKISPSNQNLVPFPPRNAGKSKRFLGKMDWIARPSAGHDKIGEARQMRELAWQGPKAPATMKIN